MDKISIIVPFYDGNKHLPSLKRNIECNTKVAKLEFEIDVELVLVNDSPWVEVQKAQIESEIFELVIVNLFENSGIHNARVKGLEVSSGKYIAFWDQDDAWSDTFIRELYRCHLKKNIGCVIGNGIFETKGKKKLILNSYGKVLFAKKYYSYFIVGNLLSSPGQCLIKKEAIPEYWLQNIMKTNCSDDLFLWCLMFKDVRVGYCNQLLYTHIDTGENFSLDKEKGYESDLEMYNILKKSKLIPEILLKIFKIRYDYNISHLKPHAKKSFDYYSYKLIRNTFKSLMLIVGVIYRVFGVEVPRIG